MLSAEQRPAKFNYPFEKPSREQDSPSSVRYVMLRARLPSLGRRPKLSSQISLIDPEVR